jgi:hypothetical protein
MVSERAGALNMARGESADDVVTPGTATLSITRFAPVLTTTVTPSTERLSLVEGWYRRNRENRNRRARMAAVGKTPGRLTPAEHRQTDATLCAILDRFPRATKRDLVAALREDTRHVPWCCGWTFKTFDPAFSGRMRKDSTGVHRYGWRWPRAKAKFDEQRGM